MATIAYQISLSIPETRRYIAQAVESDPSVFNGSQEMQLQTLIVNPLLQAYASLGDNRANAKKWARLVVIDGLDECQGASAQRYIVRILSTALIYHRVPLFIFITSRPEASIHDSFDSYDLREMVCKIVLDESYMSDAEIQRFLCSKFDQTKQIHPLRTYIPPAWPFPQTIHSLIRMTSGQFIYVATVVKAMDSDRDRPFIAQPPPRPPPMYALAHQRPTLPWLTLPHIFTELINSTSHFLRIDRGEYAGHPAGDNSLSGQESNLPF
jgi:hypothetical protein